MHWLPKTLPTSPMATDFYILAAFAPMLLWDLFRNRRLHGAYVFWFAVNVPVALAVYGLWNTPWWHAAAQELMGV